MENGKPQRSSFGTHSPFSISAVSPGASRTTLAYRRITMSKLLRGLAAGYGAKKLGGGCFSTILIFLLLWWLLGNFDIFK
jgi:hypothetical protein